MSLPPNFTSLLTHLHRGGHVGHYWKKGEGSTWWNGNGPPAPPARADIYFGVNPCISIPPTNAQGEAKPPREVRSQLSFVAALNCLFAEFDAKDFGDDKAAALAHVESLDPQPSALVDSGGGYHAYWLLDQPYLLASDADRRQAKDLQSRWVEFVGGDKGAKDLARVLRVPGTLNRKYDPPRPVVLLYCDLGIVYDLGELAAYLPALQPRPSAPAPRPGPTDRRGAYGVKALAAEVARVALAGEGTRNDTLHGAAFTLGRKVAAGLLDKSTVEQELVSAARAAGLPIGEALATTRSGLSAGILKGAPDTLPDFDVPRAKNAGTDLLRPRLTLADRLGGLTVTRDGEVVTDPAAAGRAVQWAQDAERTTDLGNARRLVRLFGDRIRYVHTWGAWLIWDGTRWVKDETGEIHRLARETVRAMYAEAADTEDSGARQSLAKWATSSESAGKLKAMVDLAQSEPGVAMHHTALDASPWLLNCLNGTIDLRTGQLHPHNRSDMLTKRIAVVYDPNATAPTWDRFLARITEDNAELSAYMQRAAGYTLTGTTTEQCLFFLYGGGANGKSTFVEAMADLMGDYWQKAPTEMIMLQRNTGIPNDLARLPGARMVVTGELSQGRKLDEAKVKDLTGGDTISARFMREEWFDFRPVFKLWMFGNHKPGIRGDDYGIWRRIRLIPFKATIADSEKDTGLPAKLRAELPGILAWAVRGCFDWQRGGLQTPDAVQSATEAYRSEMDVIGAFLDECCVLHSNAKSQATQLYKSYCAWCEANGEHALPQKQFGQRLDARGLQSKRTGKGFWRLGAGLLASQEGDDSDDEPMIRSEPKSDMNEASKNLMAHVENRFTTDHGSLPPTGSRIPSIPYRAPIRLRQQEDCEATELARIQAEAEELN